MTFLRYLFIFCVFSIFGWVIELFFRSAVNKKIINPGFMTGCVVPLYGFGAIILNLLCILFFNVNYNVIFIFIVSFILLSLLEFVTGLLLLKIFNTRLWDYSNCKLNINGFICLKFSFIWAIFALVYYYFIFPWMNDYAINFVSNTYCLFSLGIFYGAFLVDLSISINLLTKLKQYSYIIKQTIILEKVKLESIKTSTRKKFWNAIYPYISTNKFLKDKLKKK